MAFNVSNYASGAINGKLVAAEGWGNSDSNASTTAVEIYDPVTDSWSSGAPGSVARGVTANAVVGEKLYITGGRAGFGQGPFDTLEIYDGSTNSWSLGASLPLAIQNGMGAALGGKFYVVSGSVSSTSDTALTGAVQIYDPVTDTWSTGALMPTPLSGMTGGVVNGKLYVTSGITATGGLNSTLQIYDPVSDTWTTGPSAPVGRYGASSGVAGSALYVTGGVDSNGPIGELDIFSVPTYSTQVQPPINADGSSVFTVRRGVVPVKFTLIIGGVTTCELPPATIVVTRTAGGTLGSVNESVYSGSSDSGSNFRIDSCQYIYNLNSNALGVGTYRIDILINAQVVGNAVFQLK
jgi:N-acetylneuraminic acid mutarotase